MTRVEILEKIKTASYGGVGVRLTWEQVCSLQDAIDTSTIVDEAHEHDALEDGG